MAQWIQSMGQFLEQIVNNPLSTVFGMVIEAVCKYGACLHANECYKPPMCTVCMTAQWAATLFTTVLDLVENEPARWRAAGFDLCEEALKEAVAGGDYLAGVVVPPDLDRHGPQELAHVLVDANLTVLGAVLVERARHAQPAARHVGVDGIAKPDPEVGALLGLRRTASKKNSRIILLRWSHKRLALVPDKITGLIWIEDTKEQQTVYTQGEYSFRLLKPGDIWKTLSELPYGYYKV